MRVGLFGNHTDLAQRLTAAGVERAELCPGRRTSRRHKGRWRRPSAWTISSMPLEHPRRFVLDLPVGSEIDRVIDAAYVVMEPGDVVLDPTPSYWGDTLRRFRRMRHRSLYYVDVALIGRRLPPSGIRRRAGRRAWPCRWSSAWRPGRRDPRGRGRRRPFRAHGPCRRGHGDRARGQRGPPAARGLPERAPTRPAIAATCSGRVDGPWRRPAAAGCSTMRCGCTPSSRCWPRA